MTVRTVIVEDEMPSLERLKTLLEDFSNIEIVGEAQDGPAAIQLIDELKPDLAFLDIRLPVFSSFEVLQRIKHKPMVIFITAYDEYALKAFEENAVDYLLKPTDSKRLAKSIDKVLKLHQSIDNNILNVIKSVVAKGKFHDRFSVKIGNEVLFILTEDIYWFQAEDGYIFLHTIDREYIYDATLKELEDALNPKQFIRIHKSHIIAIDKIEKMKKTLRGKFKIQLKDKNKSNFEIGRTYYSKVKEKLKF